MGVLYAKVHRALLMYDFEYLTSLCVCKGD